MLDAKQAYPLRFAPIYKAKLWGGRNFERLFGRDLPIGELIGESWELADLPGGASVVCNGPLAGVGLTELTRQGGQARGRQSTTFSVQPATSITARPR